MQHDPRRASPRIGIEALCWETVGEREISSLVVDLSTHGARLERPFLPSHRYLDTPIELGPAGRGSYVGPPARPKELERVIPLQLEVPEIDEVMWARGDVVFDEVVSVKHNGGPFGLIRRTGYHISLAATRDMRLLRDYVWSVHEKQLEREIEIEMMRDEAENENAGGVDWFRAFG